LIVVTRKCAAREAAAAVREALAARGFEQPLAQVHLNLDRAYRYTASGGLVGDGEELSDFETPLAVAGVAHPERLWKQLAQAGTRVKERWSFADHHRYTRGDGKRIATRAGAGPLLATLKDAVKLVHVIPDKTAIYVPLQRVCWEVGRDSLDRLVGQVIEEGKGQG
jgi:tetraacyldisaccharide-1-P 4'-kinase